MFYLTMLMIFVLLNMVKNAVLVWIGLTFLFPNFQWFFYQAIFISFLITVSQTVSFYVTPVKNDNI